MTRCVIHIVGQPASGKTTLAKAIAAALGWQRVSIDEERIALLRPGRYWPDDDSRAWANLVSKARRESTVVETCGVKDSSPIAAHALVVRTEAPAAVRRHRLVARQRSGYRLAQHNRKYVERLMAVPPPTIAADLIWDGSAPAPLGPFLDLVRSHLE